jgi:hypothetical protein
MMPRKRFGRDAAARGAVMNIRVTTTVPHGLDAVFAAMRDQMPDLAEYMPNLDSIVVESRDDTDGETKMVNRWQANKSEVPAIARKFVSANQMYWLDHAHWIEAEKVVRWRLEMGFMTERVTCQGQTSYHAVDGGTEMRINGTLDLDLRGMMPKFLLKKAQPAIEKFVLGTVEPNFQKTADALTAYLDAQQSEA